MAKTTTRRTASTSKPEPFTGSGMIVTKKDIINRVVAKTNLKRRDVKQVVEAALQEMGESVRSGDKLRLKPFGNVRVARKKDLPNGEVFVAKLRQPNPPKV